MITVAQLQLRPVTITRLEPDGTPSDLVEDVQIDVLDQVQDTSSGTTIVDGTLAVELEDGTAAVDLIAGTPCRFRIRGLPPGPRTVTVPAGTDPISVDELPEATE